MQFSSTQAFSSIHNHLLQLTSMQSANEILCARSRAYFKCQLRKVLILLLLLLYNQFDADMYTCTSIAAVSLWTFRFICSFLHNTLNNWKQLKVLDAGEREREKNAFFKYFNK